MFLMQVPSKTSCSSFIFYNPWAYLPSVQRQRFDSFDTLQVILKDTEYSGKFGVILMKRLKLSPNLGRTKIYRKKLCCTIKINISDTSSKWAWESWYSDVHMCTDVLGPIRYAITNNEFSISVTISYNPIYDNILPSPYFMCHDDDNVVIIPCNLDSNAYTITEHWYIEHSMFTVRTLAHSRESIWFHYSPMGNPMEIIR